MASADGVKEAVEVQAAEDAAEGIAPADLKARHACLFCSLLNAQCILDPDLPPALQIILLGDSAVGKSKLVERFLMDDYHPRQRCARLCPSSSVVQSRSHSSLNNLADRHML
jgi:hypothetical protein